jgi:DNA adenine methylase
MLKLLVDNSPCSREVFNHAKMVLKYPAHFDRIKRAWAFWILCNLSFSATLSGGYKYTRGTNKSVVSFHRKKERLQKYLLDRLKNVDFESNDAIEVIKSRDFEDAFFYVDSPYISDCPVHQGHYSGYRSEDYITLLDTLSKIQ